MSTKQTSACMFFTFKPRGSTDTDINTEADQDRWLSGCTLQDYWNIQRQTVAQHMSSDPRYRTSSSNLPACNWTIFITHTTDICAMVLKKHAWEREEIWFPRLHAASLLFLDWQLFQIITVSGSGHCRFIKTLQILSTVIGCSQHMWSVAQRNVNFT